MSLFYLNDIFNIKFDIEGKFDILLRKDSLFCVAVPAQTTEGASVAGPFFIRTNTKDEKQSFCYACFPFKVCSDAYRSSMMGVKSMVMRAGSPGMSGMMDVSLKRIWVPVTEPCMSTRPQGGQDNNTTGDIRNNM